MLSSKNGPSSESGLSKIANVRRRIAPPVETIRPSSATSAPGTYCSTSSVCSRERAAASSDGSSVALSRAARCIWISGDSSNARILRTAAANSAGLLARITPWLAARDSGFTTHGNEISASAPSSEMPGAKAKKSGTASPARRKVSRCISLLRQISAASGGFPGKPSASAASAAVTVGWSPSAKIAPGGLSWNAPAITSAASCGD